MDAEVTFRTASRWGIGADPTGRPGLRVPTVLAAAALHLAFLAALGLVFRTGHGPADPAEISIPVVFMPAALEEAPTPLPQALASSTLPVPTSRVPAALAPLPPRFLPPSHPGPTLPRRNQGRPTSTPTPYDVTSQAVSPPAPPVTAPPASAAPSHDMLRALASWEVRIRQAVQDAAAYPASARLLHRDGNAQVRFDYDRGAIAFVSIAQTSHVGALDHAALAAVTRAAIPAPPAELGPQKRTMLVWVQFKLSSEE